MLVKSTDVLAILSFLATASAEPAVEAREANRADVAAKGFGKGFIAGIKGRDADPALLGAGIKLATGLGKAAAGSRHGKRDAMVYRPHQSGTRRHKALRARDPSEAGQVIGKIAKGAGRIFVRDPESGDGEFELYGRDADEYELFVRDPANVGKVAHTAGKMTGGAVRVLARNPEAEAEYEDLFEIQAREADPELFYDEEI